MRIGALTALMILFLRLYLVQVSSAVRPLRLQGTPIKGRVDGG